MIQALQVGDGLEEVVEQLVWTHAARHAVAAHKAKEAGHRVQKTRLRGDLSAALLDQRGNAVHLPAELVLLGLGRHGAHNACRRLGVVLRAST